MRLKTDKNLPWEISISDFVRCLTELFKALLLRFRAIQFNKMPSGQRSAKFMAIILSIQLSGLVVLLFSQCLLSFSYGLENPSYMDILSPFGRVTDNQYHSLVNL